MPARESPTAEHLPDTVQDARAKYLEDLSTELSDLFRKRDFDHPLLLRHVSPHMQSRNVQDRRFSANSREEHWNLIRKQYKAHPDWTHSMLDVTCSHADNEAAEVWITHQVIGLFAGDKDRIARRWINKIEWRKQMRLDVDEPVWTVVRLTGMHGTADMVGGD